MSTPAHSYQGKTEEEDVVLGQLLQVIIDDIWWLIGIAAFIVLVARLREERYGYTLRQALAADGLEMEESTLYPLLRRLEKQGLLLSEWREEEKRKKRFYRLSPMGVAMLAALTTEWRGINASLDKILPIYTHWQKPEDINQMRLKAIQHFFEHYKDLEEGKWVKIEGWAGPDDAKKEILDGIAAYEKAEAAK